MNCPDCGHDFWAHFADGCDLTSCECTTSEQGFFAAVWDAGWEAGSTDRRTLRPRTPNPYRESEPA